MKIEILHGDITEQKADAIVNAANPFLTPGAGVCGAIHSAGGEEIANECAALREKLPGKMLPFGQAVATTAGRLYAKYVIHTPGPVYENKENSSQILADSYKNALELAESLNCKSIAFPAISTGIYGFPFKEASEIALETVKKRAASLKNIREIIFVLFSKNSYEQFLQISEKKAEKNQKQFL